jgi:autotransporter adhesin
VAIGPVANATGDNAIAVGNTSTANANGVALGANTTVSSTGTDTNVALGANAKADGSTLATAAYNPGTAKLAGVTPVGEVSVGSAGAERRLTNVAAGATDTDAVNVSQLKSSVAAVAGNSVQYDDPAKTNVTLGGVGAATPVGLHNVAAGKAPTDAVNFGQLTALGNTPMTFTGNTGTVDRKLGETLAITGTSTTAGTYTGANLKTAVVGNEVQIQMADAPVFGGQVKANGFDANGQKIVNVAPGTAGTDAVNFNQLDAVSKVASKGWNVQANGDAATNVAPGDTVQFLNGQNIAVTRNGKDITIATTPDLVANSVTTGATVMNNGRSERGAGRHGADHRWRSERDHCRRGCGQQGGHQRYGRQSGNRRSQRQPADARGRCPGRRREVRSRHRHGDGSDLQPDQRQSGWLDHRQVVQQRG